MTVGDDSYRAFPRQNHFWGKRYSGCATRRWSLRRGANSPPCRTLQITFPLRNILVLGMPYRYVKFKSIACARSRKERSSSSGRNLKTCNVCIDSRFQVAEEMHHDINWQIMEGVKEQIKNDDVCKDPSGVEEKRKGWVAIPENWLVLRAWVDLA